MDFGTTNSGVAVYDGANVHVIPLDPDSDSRVMRSVLYLTRDGQTHFGQKAIHLYNAQNINRERRMGRRVVGHVVMEHSDGLTIETDVTIAVDEAEPGRLLRSLKSALATPYSGTHLYGRDYKLEELIALYLGEARQRAEAHLGQPVTAVTLGRPVHFVGAETPEDDARAQARLQQAAHLAGFEQVDFEFEPVAAATYYSSHVRRPEVILVFDFGGGTLDITAMHITPGGGAQVIAIGGVGIAGDRFDSRMVEGAVIGHFGAGVTWGDKRLPVPSAFIEPISAWEGLPALATLENRAFLHRMQAKCSAPSRLYALESLIFNFYGFALMESVEGTKRALSDSTFAALHFEGRDIDIWQPITRAQFESFTATEWRQIREAVLDVVARSGLTPAQIDAVVQTGGSSYIPAAQKLLAGLFGEEKLVVEDRFAGVTAGLGICAYQRRA